MVQMVVQSLLSWAMAGQLLVLQEKLPLPPCPQSLLITLFQQRPNPVPHPRQLAHLLQANQVKQREQQRMILHPSAPFTFYLTLMYYINARYISSFVVVVHRSKKKDTEVNYNG